MPKLTLEVTPDQHRTIKAMAALAGKSVKEFVVERTLGSDEHAKRKDDAEYQQFLEFLEKRAQKARDGDVKYFTPEKLKADIMGRG